MQAGEVRLYWLDFDRISTATDWLAPLSPDERARAASYAQPASARRFSMCRAVLRSVLGACLQQDPARVELTTLPHGKPALARPPTTPFDFNLSHSARWAVIAVGTVAALGVDVETPRAITQLPRLAQRCLAAQELADWHALAPDQQLDGFLDYWTAKEAFSKAVGRGLALGIRQIVLNRARSEFVAVPAECGAASAWQLNRFVLDDGSRVALVTQGALNLHGQTFNGR